MIAESEERLTGLIARSEEKMTGMIAKSEEKLTGMIAKSEERTTERIDTVRTEILAYIECAVMPKFDLLAEGHKTLLETLSPVDRVEALEDEVSFLKQVIKSMSRDIAELKKAQ